MWLGLDECKKAQQLRKILDYLPCLVIRSPDSFDYEDEARGVVDYNEGLTALHCNRISFSLERVAASALLSSSLKQMVNKSMLMRERLAVLSWLSR